MDRRHLRLTLACLLASTIGGCGGGGGDSAPSGPQFQSGAYVTDEGKLFFVPVVDGEVSPAQLVATQLPATSDIFARASARRVFTGHFNPSTGNFERARYSEVVFVVNQSDVKRLDLDGPTPAVTELGSGSELCYMEGIGIDLQNHANSIIDLITAGDDHDCNTLEDSGRFLQKLGGSDSQVVTGNIGYPQPGTRDAAGALTSIVGGTLTADTLSLQRVDASTFAVTPVLTRTEGLAGARRFSRGLAVGPKRNVIALNLPQTHADEYDLYDDNTGSVRLLYRVENPVHRSDDAFAIVDRAFFSGNKLFLADKSQVVALDPSADPVVPQTVVDFGAGRSVERLLDLGSEVMAVLRNADDTLTVSRFNVAGGGATDVGPLPGDTYSIVELVGDVALLNVQMTGNDGIVDAVAYDPRTHTLSRTQSARWIGGTVVTDPSGVGGLPQTIIGKVGETGLKVEGFEVAYVLATRNLDTSTSELRLFRRTALDTPIVLGTTGLVSNGHVDDLGQRVLVELRIRHSPGVTDRDIYLLDVGLNPRLVPVAVQPGVEEFLPTAEVR